MSVGTKYVVWVVKFWGDVERDKCCQSYVSLYSCGFHSKMMIKM